MKQGLRPAHYVQFLTPKKVPLHGLWLGSPKAKRVVIWVHGLGSTMFSKLEIAEKLVDRDTAVLVFNNRGHDVVARFSQGTHRRIGGSAHEVFTECVDDIEGAVRFAKAAGAKEIFLAGHSTGCQKSIYWAAKKGDGVKGIILLAPISDYAAEVKMSGKAAIQRTLKIAEAMVKRGKAQTLLPADVWPTLLDAQRFANLYSSDSKEEIFTYWAPERDPATLHEVQLPILVLLAEKDEYRDRPSKKMADWFALHLKLGDKIVIVPKVAHSFKGGEKAVAGHMHKFMKEATR